MILLDGKTYSKKLQQTLKTQVQQLTQKTGKTPHLCAVLVGDNPASKIYVANKARACKRVGINSTIKTLPANTTQKNLNKILAELSNDDTIHGILLQLPLPNGLDARTSIAHIAPQKDVDGLTNENLGKLTANESDGLVACTAKGILALLQEYNIPLAGKHCVIVGRSLLVGKPLQQLLLQQNATVTLCHSKTTNLAQITRQADVLISAVGKPNLIGKKHVKKHACVVDVAIVRSEQGMCGDVDTKQVKNKVDYLSPVPGGVGPLTVTMLLANTIIAFQNQTK